VTDLDLNDRAAIGRDPAEFAVRQEDDRLSSRTLIAAGVVAVAVGLVGVLFAGAVLVFAGGALQPSAAGPAGTRPAERSISNIEQTPILDGKSATELQRERARRLEEWGWVDRDGGVATIPIERAMDIVVSEEAR
jgi:hypothetical protein